MNDTIWVSIAEISWWIYPFIAYLILMGYAASKPRTATFQQLWSNMIFFIIISLFGMFFFVDITAHSMVYWTITFLLGTGLGWMHFTNLQVSVKQDNSVLIPGSWMTMFIIFGVMAAKYYLGSQISLDLAVLKSGKYSLQLMAIYGLCTGLFVGRIIYTKRRITLTAAPAH